jgi:hypothetical protein
VQRILFFILQWFLEMVGIAKVEEDMIVERMGTP